MPPLTRDKRIRAKYTQRLIAIPVAAGVRIFHGAQVAVNAAGFAKPAEDIADETVVGLSHESVDNTDGDDGAVFVRVQKGVFKFENAAASPVAQAQQSRPVFVADDQTVAAATANSVVSGTLDSLDEDGRPWVYIP